MVGPSDGDGEGFGGRVDRRLGLELVLVLRGLGGEGDALGGEELGVISRRGGDVGGGLRVVEESLRELSRKMVESLSRRLRVDTAFGAGPVDKSGGLD